MSDLEAVYRAAVEAAPECLDGDFASVERMVDAALATLGNGEVLYRRVSEHIPDEDWVDGSELCLGRHHLYIPIGAQ
jgi:hypothetical protein